MNIYSLARRFELKLAIAAGVDYSEFKTKALNEIKGNVEKMTTLLKGSKELREAAFNFPADPLVQFGENAQAGIDALKQIASGVFFLSNKMDDLSLEEMIKPLLAISDAVNSLADSSGSDKWGIMRDRYLNVLEIFGDYYTSQGAYGDGTKLNSMAKRELEVKLGSLTNVLDFVANGLRNPRKTGCLDILKKLAEHGLIDKVHLEKLVEKAPRIGNTDRVTRRLENHEKEQILLHFGDFLGLNKLGLSPDIHVWNKYVAPAERLLSDVFRSWLRSPDVGSRDLQDGEMIGPSLKGKKKILSKTTVTKLGLAAEAIREAKLTKDKEEKLSSEKMFGSPDVISPIKPPKNVRQLIDKLSGTERALWNKIPIVVQIKVLNGQIDLDSALEVAETHAGELVGAKFDANLFEGLS